MMTIELVQLSILREMCEDAQTKAFNSAASYAALDLKATSNAILEAHSYLGCAVACLDKVIDKRRFAEMAVCR